MNKTILLMMLMTLSSLVCKSQSITTEDLKGGVWQDTEVAWYERTYETYTDSVLLTTYDCIIKDKWESVSFSHPYYLVEQLPDSIDSYTFNFSKVGKKTSGKYIVKWNEEMQEVLWSKIIHFSGDTLKLQHGSGINVCTTIWKRETDK